MTVRIAPKSKSSMWIAEAAAIGLVVENPELEESDISLSTEQKIGLSLITREILAAPILEKSDLQPGRRAMFYGPPGTGKTLAAEVVASILKWPLVRVSSAKVYSQYLGESGRALERIMSVMKASGDVVWLFDEADSLLRTRSAQSDGAAREMDAATNVLLSILSNPTSLSSGLLIFATNFETSIDPAMWRRFDHVVKFDVPVPVGRRMYIRSLFKRYGQPASKIEGSRDAWMEELVDVTNGWSYSQIESFWIGEAKAVILGEPAATTANDLGGRAIAFDRLRRPAGSGS